MIETPTSPGGRTEVMAEGVDYDGPYARLRHAIRRAVAVGRDPHAWDR